MEEKSYPSELLYRLQGTKISSARPGQAQAAQHKSHTQPSGSNSETLSDYSSIYQKGNKPFAVRAVAIPVWDLTLLLPGRFRKCIVAFTIDNGKQVKITASFQPFFSLI